MGHSGRFPKKILSAYWTTESSGVVSLTRDWVQKDLPPLFWGSTNEPLPHLRRAPPLMYGDLSGYFTQGAWLTFCVRASRFPNYDLVQNGVFVAGQFNDWSPDQSRRTWRLEVATISGETYFLLNVQRDRIFKRSKTAFKFVTGTGEWLELPSDAPNTITDKSGNLNFFVHPHRTGHHQFLFSTPHPIDHSGQSTVIWRQDGHEEEALMMPGDYLHKIGSRLEQGAIVQDGLTTFRLFAPRASGVSVSVFWNLDQSDRQLYECERVDAGSWEVHVPQDLHGAYYFFYVRGEASDAHSAFDPSWPVLDPWAVACTGATGPAIVVDKRRLRRPSTRFQPPCWHDLVIAEAHVRDLTTLAPVQMSDRERLGFAGLAKWVRSPEFYLSKLGVNAVELQPIQQHDAPTVEEYHWGYMTNNYFSPASQYAMAPEKASQIEEFQDLVSAFHERNLAVILDVVYNHVGEPNPLQPIDKHYYFELSHDGHYMNWSGCGNTLCSSSPMARRLIIESLQWLVEMYDVDGFRFDLAELLGVETLREIERELKKIKPSIILIAEPWSFRGHIQHELKKTGFASWNDGYRENVREYILGRGSCEAMQYFIGGSLGHMASWPAQTVNYVESHDDRCWIDRITENENFDGFDPSFLDRRRTHLMVAMLMMSLGIPMLHSGMDFMRSKRGHNNTYKRGDLNAIDYRRAIYYSGTHEYFRKWLAFRQSDFGKILRLESRPGSGYFRFFCSSEVKALGVLYNADRALPGRRLFFAINPEASSVTLNLEAFDVSRFRQIADHERLLWSGIDSARPLLSGFNLELMPFSCGLWVEDR